MTEILAGQPTPTIDPNTPAAPLVPTPGQPSSHQVPPAPNGPIPTSDPNNPPIQPAPTAYTWDGADDDLKTFVGQKTPLEIAKELKGAQALLGKKTIGIPGEGSTPEEQAAFHKARGVPESADGYKFDDVISDITKDLPEGLVVADPEREKRFREFAKASNLSAGEARELIKRELSHEIESRKASVAASAALQKQTSDLITQTWGTKKEEYSQDVETFMRHVGVDNDVLAVINDSLGTKPEARMKFLAFAQQQGMMLREGGQQHGAALGAAVGSMTPQQATAAKNNYIAQGDNRQAYMTPMHPRHKEVTDQMTQFLKVEKGR